MAFCCAVAAREILHAQESQLLDSHFLDSIRSEAKRSHPAAKSATLLADAATRDIHSIRLWEDPVVGLSLKLANAARRRDDGDIAVSYDQPIPKLGLYQANLSKAETMRRVELQKSRSTRSEIGAAVVKDLIELALADESIALQTTQIKWLKLMTENARQMAANPGSSSIDTLRLETEVIRQTQILDAARRTRDSLSKNINLQLSRPINSSWPTLMLPQNPSPIPIANSEIARIPSTNPKVASIKETAKAAALDTEILNQERKPQLAFSVGANFYSGSRFRNVNAGFSMSLPYFNRSSHDAKSEAARLRQKAAIQDVEATKLEISSRIVNAVSEATINATQARAYSNEVYQHTLQTTQAIEGSWINSQSTLTELLDANRSLFSVKLEQRRFIAMQQVALEGLNLLVPKND